MELEHTGGNLGSGMNAWGADGNRRGKASEKLAVPPSMVRAPASKILASQAGPTFARSKCG